MRARQIRQEESNIWVVDDRSVADNRTPQQRANDWLTSVADEHDDCHGSAGTPLGTHAGGKALGLQDARTAIRT
jgi:hypothetical protein